MRLLKNKLSLLKNMRYLEAQVEKSNIINVELLENGKLLRQQIEKQCCKAETSKCAEIEKIPIVAETNDTLSNFLDINPRLRFVYTNEFRKNMQHLKEASQTNFIRSVSIDTTIHELEDGPIRFKCKSGENNKLLITDNFFHRAFGLEKLYHIQRERKIWWMRFSADPSRYFLEPYDVINKKSTMNIANAQSITIKARLPIGDVGVEHITLVPLNEASLLNERDFEIYDNRTKKQLLPAVIRTVINLDVAACALIFDAAANKRENTLFLNRKLTPYQCLVTCEDKDSNALKDLCAHISNVMRRAGLRLLNLDEYFGKTTEPNSHFDIADKLGIPYTILVNLNSLNSGLLELRNRDTTLNETIHISDVPGYLLSIFHAK